MKKIFLFLSLLLPSICFSNEAQPKVFIMLDIDNTLVDKIAPKDKAPDTAYAEELSKKGFLVQSLEFYSIKDQDPFFSFYKKDKNSRFLTTIESEDKIKISETIVVRPSIQNFLEQLNKLKTPVHILICSRSGNGRVKNLVENLKLEINKKPFKEVVDFVPRENFRVEIKSGNGRKNIAKSAWDLRQSYDGKFGKIQDTDYVILIDQLSDHEFIYSDLKKDMNITIPHFYSREDSMFNLDEDKNTMQAVLDKIKDFIK